MIAEGFFAKALLIKKESLEVGTLDEGVITVSLAAKTPRMRNVTNQTELRRE